MSFFLTRKDFPNQEVLRCPENEEFLRKKNEEIAATFAKLKAEKEAKATAAAAKRSAAVSDQCYLPVNFERLMRRDLQKKRKSTDADAPAASSSSKPSRKKAKTSVSAASASSSSITPAGATDLFSVHLEGEEDGTVEIYDSCDELRRKIYKHLATTGATKAQFLRDLICAASFPDYSFKLQSKQLADFLALRGATGGNSSKVCYASYVYFEKKRIAEGEGKSEHRLDMEDEWETEGGLTREMRREKYFMAAGTTLIEDEVGRIRAVPY